MANEVDQRVVQMQFDNRQFEKNAAETMETLKKLDDSLKFENAAQGFLDITKAADNVDFTKLQEGVSNVELKFSTMSVAAIAAISHIVDSAISAGAHLAKSMSIDQLTAGFNKYTQKTSAVQTIMNATGLSIDEVSASLEKLNWFTDETSYNFTDMVNNIAKFTNNKVPLEQAISAIEGVALVAADAGANANEASRAMYNFSQAISTGSVRLIDWKSIENANMATSTFKETVIETAEQLGTLKRVSDGYYETLKGSEVSATNFNNALSEGWFTNEVLMQSLSKYSEYADEVYKVSDAFDTCTDAMRATNSVGMELGERAFKAGQQAKTFTDAINATKDAVSSGWMRTFEILFGDYEESVDIWSRLTDQLWDIFASGAQSRNDILKAGLSTGWKNLIVNQIDDADRYKKEIISVARAHGIAVDDMIDQTGSFEKSLELGWASGNILSEALENVINEIDSLTAEERAAVGYTENSANSFVKFWNSIKSGKMSIQEIADQLGRLSGRENIIQSIGNAFDGLMSIVKPFKDAFSEIFPPITGERLYELTVKLRDFTAQFKLSDEAANTLRVTMKGLLLPFKAVFQVIRVGFSLVSNFALVIWKLVDAFVALPSKAGAVKKALESVFGEERYSRIASAFSKIAAGIGDAFSSIVDKISVGFKKMKESETLANIFKPLYDLLYPIGGWILDKIVEGFETLAEFDYSKITSWATGAMESLVQSFQTLRSIIAPAATYVKDFIASFKGLTISGAISEMSKAVKDAKKSFLNFAENDILSGFLNSVTEKTQGLVSVFNNMGQSLLTLMERLTPAKTLIFSFGVAVTGSLFSIMNAVTKAGRVLGSFSGILDAVRDRIKPSKYSQVANALIILAAGLMTMTLVDSNRLKQATESMMFLMGGLALFMNVMAAANKFLGKDKDFSSKMKTLSNSILVVSSAMLAISVGITVLSMANIDNLAPALLALGVSLVEMVIAMRAITKFAPDLTKGSWFMIGFALSLTSFIGALKKISQTDFGSINNAFENILFIALAMKLISVGLNNANFKGAGGMLIFALDLLVLVGILKVIAKVDMAKIAAGLANAIPLIMLLSGIGLAMKIAGGASMGSGASFLFVSFAMVVLAKVLKDISSLSNEQIEKAKDILSNITVMLGVLGLTFKTGADAVAVGKEILKISASIIALGFVVKYLGSIDLKTLVVGELAIAGLFLMFGKVLRIGKISGDAWKSIIAISVIIGILVSALALLTLNPKIEETLSATLAMTAVIGAIGLLFKGMQNVPISGVLKVATSLGIILVSIGFAVGVLNKEDWKQTLSSAIALSAVILSVSLCVKLLNGMNIKIDSKTILQLGIILTEAIAAIYVVSKIRNEGKLLDSIAALSTLILSLSGVLAILNKLYINGGISWKNLGKGTLQLEAVMLVATASVAAIGYAIEKLKLEKSIGAATLFMDYLSLMIPTLSLTAVLSALIGKLAPAMSMAVFGTIEMVKFMGTLGLFMIAAGWLMSNDDVKKFMQNAVDFFGNLGDAIGALVGGLVTGFTNKLLDINLEGFGSQLSALADGIGNFVEKSKGLSEESVKAVTNLAEVILLLDRNRLLSRFIPSLVDNEPVITKFGVMLDELADPLIDFCEKVSASTFDVSKVTAAIDSAKVIASLNESLQAHGGYFQSITGEKSLTAFAEELHDFIVQFIGLNGALRVVDIDYAKIEAFTKSTASLIGLTDVLQAHGGLAQMLSGEKSLTQFGIELSNFGSRFANFASYIKPDVFNDSFVKATESAVAAAEMIAGMSDSLQKSGGWIQDIAGSKDLGLFGEQLSKFGEGVSSFVTDVANLDYGDYELGIKAAEMIAGINEKLPKTGGVFQWFTGSEDIGKFSEKLESFGNGLYLYSRAVALIQNTEDIVAVTEAFNGVIDMITGMGELNPLSIYLFSQQLSNLAQTGVSSFVTSMNSSVDNIALAIDGLLSNVMLQLETLDVTRKFQDTGTAVGEHIKTGVTNSKETLETVGKNIASYITTGIESEETKFTDSGKFCIDGLIAGIEDQTNRDPLLHAMTKLAKDSKLAFDTTLGIASPSKEFYNSGIYSIMGYTEGIDDGQPSVIKGVKKLGKSLTDYLKEIPKSKDIQNIGGWVNESIAEGIENNYSIPETASFKMGSGIVSSLKKSVNPTVIRDEIGRFIISGIAEGITSDMSAEEAAERKAQNIVKAFQTAINTYSTDIDTASMEYELWKKSNPDSTATDDYTKKVEMFQKQIESQASIVESSNARYRTMVQSLGEESEATKEAYQDFLQEQMTLADLAQNMNDMQKERSKQFRETAIAYSQLVSERKDELLKLGMTIDQIESWARDQTGFDPTYTEKVSKREIIDIESMLAEYSRDVDVIISDSLTSGVSSGIASSLQTVSQAATVAGENISQNMANGITKNTPAITQATATIGEETKKSLVENVINGASEGLSGVGDALVDGVSKGTDAVLNFLGIASPSKYFIWVGQMITEGLKIGMLQGAESYGRSFSESVINGVEEGSEDISSMMSLLAIGLKKSDTNARDTIGEAISNASDYISNENELFLQKGYTLGEQIAYGIKSAVSGQSGLGLADWINRSIKDASNKIDEYGLTEPIIAPAFDFSNFGIGLDALKSGVGDAMVSSTANTQKEYENVQNGGKEDRTSTKTVNNYNFTQNNTSPKALSTAEIYRQTSNQFARLKGVSKA